MGGIQDPIVRVENLTAGYEGTLIIDNISFEVDRGEVFVILGGSGSGKSTILKQMIGLYKPMSGKILRDPFKTAPASSMLGEKPLFPV